MAVDSNRVPTGAVSITGTVAQNHVLVAGNSLADADGVGSVGYLWQSSADAAEWTDLAAGNALLLTEAQVGMCIRVLARYADGRGSNEAVASAPTALVAAVSYAPTSAATIAGTSGDDTLWSTIASDVIVSGAGDDNIQAHGTPGDDQIDVGAGHDTVIAGDGNDAIVGGSGDDLLAAFDGNDSVDGGLGSDELEGGDGNDILGGGAGNDTLYGGAGDDALDAGSDDDEAWGGGGNDAIDGGAGNDTLGGDDGNDTLVGGAGNDRIDEGQTQGDNQLDGGAGDDTVRGGNGNDSVGGGAGNDWLDGDEGSDSLDGGTGNDTLLGGGGNDTLRGGAGYDVLQGGAGNDVYVIGSRDFSIYDSAGNDAVVVETSFVKVPTGLESVSYIDGAQALPYWIDALLLGDGASFRSLVGAAGTYYFTFPTTLPAYDTSTADAEGFQPFTPQQQAFARQALQYVASVAGLSFVESATAAAANTIAFADNLQSASAGYAYGPGSSFRSSDIFLSTAAAGNLAPTDGIHAALTLIHELGHALGLKHPFGHVDAIGAVGETPYLPDAEDDTAWSVMSYTSHSAQYHLQYSPLDIAALQYLYGPSRGARVGDDVYAVDAGTANFIWDGAGSDTLDAGGQSQPLTLYLEPGYWGYVGTQAELISAAGQVTVNFGSVIENLIGGSGNDALSGNAADNAIQGGGGDDTLAGGAGDDTLAGGSGDDTYVVEGVGDMVVENADQGLDLVRSAVGLSLAANVENLTLTGYAAVDGGGNDAANTLLGNDAANRLSGLGGNDVLAGGNGDDTLYGGGGNDVFQFGAADGGVDLIADLEPGDVVRIAGAVLAAGVERGNGSQAGAGAVQVDVAAGVTTLYAGTDTAAGADVVLRIGGSIAPYLFRLAGSDISIVANTAPTLSVPLADAGAAEDSPFAVSLPAGSFFDADAGDSLSYAALQSDGAALPAWLHFDAAACAFSGTPGNGDVGTLSLRVTATDGSAAAVFDDFVVNVLNTNDAPSLAHALADCGATEDAAFAYVFAADSFADVDAGDSFTYSATRADGSALPAWLSFDAAARSFSGTPPNAAVGALSVRVTATDSGGAAAADDFTIAVANVNDAPQLARPLAVQTALEDAPFVFAVPGDSFADIDGGDSLNYGAALADGGALPSWLGFDPVAGTFSGTPGNGDVGTLNLRLAATDGSAAAVFGDFVLNVANTNDAPTLTQGLPDASATQDVAFAYVVAADSFADVDAGDAFIYSATRGDGGPLPAWLSFAADSRSFTGIPPNAAVGTLTVRLTATDSGGGAAADDFAIAVANVNDAPLLARPLAAQAALEDAAFALTVPGDTFAEIDAGDALSYSAGLADGSALPPWLAFDPATCTFSGTPGNDEVGGLPVRLAATDTHGARAVDDFVLDVVNANDAPLPRVPLIPQVGAIGAAFAYTVPLSAFGDIDRGDTLDYAAALGDGGALPAWLNFDAATRSFFGTPDAAVSFTIAVRATDSGHAVAASSFGLVVLAARALTAPATVAGSTAQGYYVAGIGGNEAVRGGAGNDIVDGGAGNDTLIGGLGDDTYIVDATLDRIVEYAGGGSDTVRAAVDCTLPANVEQLILIGAARNGSGNAAANRITGNDNDNRLDGMAAADTLVGGLGNDTYVVDNAGDQALELDDAGIDTVRSSVGHVLGANIENLVLTGAAGNGSGNGLDNALTGNAGANRLDGLAGADTMAGGGGGDTYVVDRAGDRVVELAGGGIDSVLAGIDWTLDDNCENLTLGGSAVAATGNALANLLVGNAADNILDGGGGSDVLRGGGGNDTYRVDLVRNAVGGLSLQDTVTELAAAGEDTVVVRVAAALVASIPAILAAGANVEHLDAGQTGNLLLNFVGNANANRLTGNAAANRLDGGIGVDTLSGGAGNDTYVIDNGADVVDEAVDGGIDTVLVGIAAAGVWTLAAAVENATLTNGVAAGLVGNDLDNALTGNAAGNTLSGGAGNDVLDGRGGADSLSGGLGDDSYVVDSVGDVVAEEASAGFDTVRSSVSRALPDNVENLTLTGAAAINGSGNARANMLVGNAGANRLDGAAGADTLAGGAGGDVYVVDDVGDSVVEERNQGTDLVLAGVSWVLGANVENLTLGGTAVAATGNELANSLVGNGGANVLDGRGGRDVLAGGGGDDRYYVDLVRSATNVVSLEDTVLESLGQGNDTLVVGNAGGITMGVAWTVTATANVENVDLSATAALPLNASGNGLANVLTGNLAANTLRGGAGSDTYIAAPGDTVSERIGTVAGGTDELHLKVAALGGALATLAFADLRFAKVNNNRDLRIDIVNAGSISVQGMAVPASMVEVLRLFDADGNDRYGAISLGAAFAVAPASPAALALGAAGSDGWLAVAT